MIQHGFKEAEKVYNELERSGVDVLIDDRNASAGEKFKDSDLIGIPHRVIVSNKSIEKGGVEYVDRIKNETKILSTDYLIKHMISKFEK